MQELFIFRYKESNFGSLLSLITDYKNKNDFLLQDNDDKGFNILFQGLFK